MDERWQSRLREIAAATAYPVTPELWPGLQRSLTGGVRRRPAARLAWMTAVLALLLVVLGAVLFSVPTARAALYRVLRIGAVQIFVEPATPTAARPTPQATPVPTPTPDLRPPFDLKGRTTLEDARQALGPAFRIPNLGEPDLIFLQQGEGPLAVLVWLDPSAPDRARWALYILGAGVFADKGAMHLVEQTQVGSSPALWMTGPHILQLRNGQSTMRSLVTGNVLIWQQGEASYRLETSGTLEEAVRVAESLE
ncbi:MAG TPA: hypothetical protein VK449_00485 [Anaerolineales bacterium]|nr:hypothetical protein [Anaerolineales bacterium]